MVHLAAEKESEQCTLLSIPSAAQIHLIQMINVPHLGTVTPGFKVIAIA